MLQAGLRVGEVAALSVGDVRIRERSGIVRIRQGKGRKEREVPLNATAGVPLSSEPNPELGIRFVISSSS
jgi:integrase/recombinase XerC